MAERLQGRDWLAPGRLVELLDELRWSGYGLGTGQYIAAQDLILALAARGENLDRPERLKGLLGPVVCGTPQEQEEFGAHFDAWAARLAPAEPELPPPSPIPEELKGLRLRGSR